MSFSKFFTGGGLAALAAALVVTAVPAEAQDRRNWRVEREESGARQGGGQQAQRQAPAQEVRSAPQPQRQWAQQQPQARQQGQERSWQGRGGQQSAQQQAQVAQQRAGREWNRSDRSGRDWNQSQRRAETGQERGSRAWNRGGDGQAQAQAQAQIRARQQAQAQQRQQREWNAARNGGTVSRNWERNGTYANRDRNGSYRDGWRDGRRADTRQDWRQNQQAYRDGYRAGDRDDRRWDRRWRDNNRYNWSSYRNSNRTIFRLGTYYAPYRNYSYRRLNIGFFLDSLFYSNRYWINDPWQYRLPDVYGPYRWVRYYDDALLVDVYSGQVVDVIHDFFW